MRARSLGPLLAATWLGCTTPTAAPPAVSAAQLEPDGIAAQYTVHFDPVRPDKVAQFEGARREFLGVLAEHRTHDARGTFLQSGSSLFLTVRGFDAYADLDARGPARARALQGVPQEAIQRYDDQSDSALAPPHHTEVWVHLANLDYRAPGPALSPFTAPVSRMLSYALEPGLSESRCDEAWPRVQGALMAARYPLSRVTFYSSIGSGNVIAFWVAPSRAVLESAPSVQDAVAEILGREKAAEWLACMDANVIRTESSDVVPRPDLTGQPAALTAE